jgi:hypothetical protein
MRVISEFRSWRHVVQNPCRQYALRSYEPEVRLVPLLDLLTYECTAAGPTQLRALGRKMDPANLTPSFIVDARRRRPTTSDIPRRTGPIASVAPNLLGRMITDRLQLLAVAQVLASRPEQWRRRSTSARRSAVSRNSCMATARTETCDGADLTLQSTPDGRGHRSTRRSPASHNPSVGKEVMGCSRALQLAELVSPALMNGYASPDKF